MKRVEATAKASVAGSKAGRFSKFNWAFFSSLYGVAVHGGLPYLKRNVNRAFSNVRKSKALFATDMVCAFLAFSMPFLLRYGIDTIVVRPEVIRALLIAAPQYLAVCAIVFPLSGLYSRNWRYGSISDLSTILRAVSITSVVLICVLFFGTRLVDVPRSAILAEILLLTAFLSASRLSFRVDELRQLSRRLAGATTITEKNVPLLLVGAGDAADLYLRALNRDNLSPYVPVACLDINSNHKGKLLRGVPIMGSVEDFREVVAELTRENKFPRHIVFTDIPSIFGEEVSEKLIQDAESMGIAVSKLSRLTELREAKEGNRFELKSIELTDLLERPQAALDHNAILRLIEGRRVLITGAGGSIGSELTYQVAACGPSELVLIENSEFNLYEVDIGLAERFPAIKRFAHLCNVRHAARVDEIFDRHQPELVFHAAALKHVPMVEMNPCEGALTNVIGSMNVANAVKRTGALAMVQISTDKVVNPTSVMGATKRLAELYCQALDLQGFEAQEGPRFMTVRFGNVLGSSGSLIPLFKRQIAKGGPLTVTDARMTRFFMTIREAVQLTLQASSYGLEGEIGQGEIFVLDMGEPIKIIDIAERMVRLAGFTPNEDIAIEMIGLRPGEKLYEELFDTEERRVPSVVPGVLGAVPSPVPLRTLVKSFSNINYYAELGAEAEVLKIIGDIIPGYRPKMAPAAIAPVSFPAVDIGKMDAGQELRSIRHRKLAADAPEIGGRRGVPH